MSKGVSMRKTDQSSMGGHDGLRGWDDDIKRKGVELTIPLNTRFKPKNICQKHHLVILVID